MYSKIPSAAQDVLAAGPVLKRCATVLAHAPRAALSAADAWLARLHLFWIGVTLTLPVGALAACWLLEPADGEAWAVDSEERWLRLASVLLVLALLAPVPVMLFLESRTDDPAAALAVERSTEIPPPD